MFKIGDTVKRINPKSTSELKCGEKGVIEEINKKISGIKLKNKKYYYSMKNFIKIEDTNNEMEI